MDASTTETMQLVCYSGLCLCGMSSSELLWYALFNVTRCSFNKNISSDPGFDISSYSWDGTCFCGATRKFMFDDDLNKPLISV